MSQQFIVVQYSDKKSKVLFFYSQVRAFLLGRPHSLDHTHHIPWTDPVKCQYICCGKEARPPALYSRNIGQILRTQLLF